VPGLVLLVLGLLGIVLSVSDFSLFGRQWNIHATIASALLTIVGSQIVVLALSARTFAVYVLNEKPDRILEWGRDHVRLESGLIAGAIVFLIGFVIDAVIVGIWINRGFGELSEERLLVLGSVLIILGLQAFFSSFFLSILGLARDRQPNWPRPE
jgi:hypothetical protein